MESNHGKHLAHEAKVGSGESMIQDGLAGESYIASSNRFMIRETERIDRRCIKSRGEEGKIKALEPR
jgi:hypothetical protein